MCEGNCLSIFGYFSIIFLLNDILHRKECEKREFAKFPRGILEGPEDAKFALASLEISY